MGATQIISITRIPSRGSNEFYKILVEAEKESQTLMNNEKRKRRNPKISFERSVTRMIGVARKAFPPCVWFENWVFKAACVMYSIILLTHLTIFV